MRLRHSAQPPRIVQAVRAASPGRRQPGLLLKGYYDNMSINGSNNNKNNSNKKKKKNKNSNT